MDMKKINKFKKEYANKAQDFAEDYKGEVEDIRDTVVGTVKEKTGQIKDDKILELKGKLQKAQASNGMPTKVIASVGIVALIALLIGLILKKDNY